MRNIDITKKHGILFFFFFNKNVSKRFFKNEILYILKSQHLKLCSKHFFIGPDIVQFDLNRIRTLRYLASETIVSNLIIELYQFNFVRFDSIQFGFIRFNIILIF